MTIQQKIDMACSYINISRAELARRLGYKTAQAFQKRYQTGKFTIEELEEIGKVIGCKYVSYFEFEDNTKI